MNYPVDPNLYLAALPKATRGDCRVPPAAVYAEIIRSRLHLMTPEQLEAYRRQSGFTLVEAMLVLAAIAVVVGLAFFQAFTVGSSDGALAAAKAWATEARIEGPAIQCSKIAHESGWYPCSLVTPSRVIALHCTSAKGCQLAQRP